MKTTKLTCISCPQGCRLSVDHEAHALVAVSYNQCKRGIRYAKYELINPCRMVTTTVKTDSAIGLLPVKTKNPIPKHLMRHVVEELSRIVIKGPVRIGDVVKHNICDTHIDVVATRNIS